MRQISITKSKPNKHIFVIQKHKATQLHYDFRLQIGEKMVSWAITKGPTLDPKQRRLARRVDDHEMNHNDFEGVIPEGNYGAGPVMIWDEGYFSPEIEIEKGILQKVEDYDSSEKVLKEGLKNGQIKFRLSGKKLKGSFALVKTPAFGENSWLLIKHKDKYIKENYDPNKFDFSARSGLSLDEINKKYS